MYLFRSIALKAAIISTLIVIALIALGITVVVIPNAFFLLAALVILGAVSIITSYCREKSKCCNSCNDRPFCGFWSKLVRNLVFAIALIVFAVALSFFVVAGVLVLPILVVWLGLFLLLAVIFSLFD